MINPQWFELPMFRINFHGPKYVRAIEVVPNLESIHVTIAIAMVNPCCALNVDEKLIKPKMSSKSYDKDIFV